jgi:hypothetical protein
MFETSHTLGRALPLATQDGLLFRPSSVIINSEINEEIFPNRRRRVAVLNVTRAQRICHDVARVSETRVCLMMLSSVPVGDALRRLRGLHNTSPFLRRIFSE